MKRKWFAKHSLSPAKLPGADFHVSTARRQRFWDLCAVLFFLLLLPYVCSLLFGRQNLEKTDSLPAWQEGGENTVLISCRESAGVRLVSLENYVAGALAASIPADCQEETLKAQAVLLRTLCLEVYYRKERGEEPVPAEETGQEYLDEKELRRLWGTAFEEKYDRLLQAVSETKGLYMTVGGQLKEPAYCWLSAGKTRDGREVLGEEYAYLLSVDCSHDVEAEDYKNSVSMGEEDFWETLGISKQGKLSLVRDSAGYVLWVKAGGMEMSGEKFRTCFSLPSACFQITSREGEVILESKGVGHGLGFCQHEADRRASQGEDYISLLKFFFQDAEITRK